MTRVSGLVLCVLLGSSNLGCLPPLVSNANRATALDWTQSHVSLRAYGRSGNLALPDDEELLLRGVRPRQHHVSLELESLSLRDTVGHGGQPVVLGVEIRGAGPRPIKTVIDVVHAKGPHALVSFADVPLLQPFVYRGGHVEITLWLKTVRPAHVGAIRGQLAGAGDMLRRLHPLASTGTALARNVFERVFTAVHPSHQLWRYAFKLRPIGEAVGADGDALVEGRHILVFRPPSVLFPGFDAAVLVDSLRLQGHRLAWREDGREFLELPYVILGVRRQHRLNERDSPALRMLRHARAAFGQGNFDMAESGLVQVAGLLAEDPYLTDPERRLEQMRAECLRARILTSRAHKEGRVALTLDGLRGELSMLVGLANAVGDRLSDVELRDIELEGLRLTAMHEKLAGPRATAQALKSSLSRLSQAVARAAAARAADAAAQRRLETRYECVAPHCVRTRGRVTTPILNR